MPFQTISAVLPAFNEEENIETATRRTAEALGGLDLSDKAEESGVPGLGERN